MKHIWSILCQKSIIDQDTNQISLINSLEQLNLPKNFFGKTFLMEIHLISYFFTDKVAQEDELEQTVAILDPQGNKLKELNSPIKMNKNSNKFRLRTIFDGINLTIPGVYKFTMSVKQGNSRIADSEVPLEIKIQE